MFQSLGRLGLWQNKCIKDREGNGSCLYVSYFSDSMYFWILKRGGVTNFQKIKGSEVIAYKGIVQNLDDFLTSKSF